METWLIVVIGGYMLSASLAMLIIYMNRKGNGFTSVGDLTVAVMCFIVGPFVLVALISVLVSWLLLISDEYENKKVF